MVMGVVDFDFIICDYFYTVSFNTLLYSHVSLFFGSVLCDSQHNVLSADARHQQISCHKNNCRIDLVELTTGNIYVTKMLFLIGMIHSYCEKLTGWSLW